MVFTQKMYKRAAQKSIPTPVSGLWILHTMASTSKAVARVKLKRTLFQRNDLRTEKFMLLPGNPETIRTNRSQKISLLISKILLTRFREDFR